MTIQTAPLIIRALDAGGFDGIIRIGCIRLGHNNPYGGPYYHVNSSHFLGGFVGSGPDGRQVDLNDNGNMIVTGAAEPGEQAGVIVPMHDETMARRHVFAGGSGLPWDGVIQLYAGSTLVSPLDDRWNDNLANVWLLGVSVRPGEGLDIRYPSSAAFAELVARVEALENRS